MALLTLTQYWTEETARRTTAVAATRSALSGARAELASKRAAFLAAGAEERRQADRVAELRRKLAAIPMPADGDPLLQQMNDALASQARARVALTQSDLACQDLNARVARLELTEREQAVAVTAAQGALTAEAQQAAIRQAMADLLTSGDLMNLVADASQALSDFEAGARAKIEAEFPANANPDEDFLTRVRDRRDLVAASASEAASVYTAATLIANDALSVSRDSYAEAFVALRRASEAAPLLAADRATLERLAGLALPLLSAEQSAALKDESKKAAREAVLDRLGAVDIGERARRSAQAVYDKALNEARKTDPDTAQASLDAGLLKTEADDLAAKNAALAAARAALSQADRDLLDAWFATVPELLWEELEALDAAVARLNGLKNPTPAALIASLADKEDLLVKALADSHLEERQKAAKATALAAATSARQAERDTAPRRARAMSRSAGVF